MVPNPPPKKVLVKNSYEKNITDLIKEVTCMKKEKPTDLTIRHLISLVFNSDLGKGLGMGFA